MAVHIFPPFESLPSRPPLVGRLFYSFVRPSPHPPRPSDHYCRPLPRLAMRQSRFLWVKPRSPTAGLGCAHAAKGGGAEGFQIPPLRISMLFSLLACFPFYALQYWLLSGALSSHHSRPLPTFYGRRPCRRRRYFSTFSSPAIELLSSDLINLAFFIPPYLVVSYLVHFLFSLIGGLRKVPAFASLLTLILRVYRPLCLFSFYLSLFSIH